MFSIGVVGYSNPHFNISKAESLLLLALTKTFKKYDVKPKDCQIVSGLTDLGIPAIAYRIAKHLHMYTVGIACSKADEYKVFPVDKKIIIGSDWGDESATFLKSIDCLIRIGGGKQSMEEVKTFKHHYPTDVFEYELPTVQETNMGVKEMAMSRLSTTVDTITMDVPLFIRLLEYAREDAKTDMDLHNLAEKVIFEAQSRVLTMEDYIGFFS